MVILATHSLKGRTDLQYKEPTNKVTTKALCIQEAEAKRWFSTGLMTQMNQNHTVGGRIKAHEEKMSWQTRS